MAQITSEEVRILIKFLKELKDYKEAKTKKQFIPRQISIIYQNPDEPKKFLWLSYHKWFKKVFKNEGVSKNGFLQTALDIPMSIIVNLEKALKKKRLLSRTDEKKLDKAAQLLKEILFQWK